jgi:ABC-type multidrug transport system permease subunit
MALARSRLEKACDMYWLLAVIYVVLLLTLGILSIRKGHWIMFIIGIFVPLFWFIGALLPPKRRLA